MSLEDSKTRSVADRALTFVLPVVVAGVLVAVGCSVQWLEDLAGSKPQAARVPFPHRPHLAEELACADCHQWDEEKGTYSPTTFKTCEICHKTLDKDKEPEQRVDRFYQDEKPKGPLHTTLSSEIIFSHTRHKGDNLDCKNCHGDLAASDSLGPEMQITMTMCMDCHAANGVSNDCATCHREIRRDRRPPSHDTQWPRVHGTNLLGDPVAQKECWLCHTESTCNGCHLQVMPESHNNQFRRRSHGLFVSMDRETCRTCHQSNFCDRCHNEVLPSTHTGTWGSPKDRHCLVCHEPVGSEPSCSVCHKSTPSHSRAAPKPPGHTPGMNCRQCHGLSAPLPHVDNGDNCNDCHH
jgi:hypothetical protein